MDHGMEVQRSPVFLQPAGDIFIDQEHDCTSWRQRPLEVRGRSVTLLSLVSHEAYLFKRLPLRTILSHYPSHASEIPLVTSITN